MFVCSGLTALSTLSVISRWCLVVTGSSMLTFIVLSSPTLKIRVPSGEQLVTLLTTLVCRGPGSNPVPPYLGADSLPTELPRPVTELLSHYYQQIQHVICV